MTWGNHGMLVSGEVSGNEPSIWRTLMRNLKRKAKRYFKW